MKKIIDWEEDADASYYAKISTSSCQVFNKEEALPSPYAPINKGALYLKVKGSKISHLFTTCKLAEKGNGTVSQRMLGWKDASLFDHSSYYIAVSFLRSLALNTIRWPQLDRLLDDPPNPVADEALKYSEENKLFTAEAHAAFHVNHVAQDLWVPIRSQYGDLILCEQVGSVATLNAANNLKKEWELALSTIDKYLKGGKGSTVRYQTPKVGTLKVRILDACRARFKDRTKSVDDMFTEYIQKINKGEEKNGGKLELLKVTDRLDKEWMLLSEDPFGLYRTYIHQDGHDAYMKSLLPDCYDSPEDIERELYRRTETRPLPVKSVLGLSNLNSRKRLIDQKAKTMVDDARVASKKAVERADFKVRKNEQHAYKITNVTHVPLNARKLHKMARATKLDDQFAVMGKQSAPKIAAETLQWKWANPSEHGPRDKKKGTEQVEATQEKQEEDEEMESEDADIESSLSMDEEETEMVTTKKTKETKKTRENNENNETNETKTKPVSKKKYFQNQMSNSLYIAEWLHLSAWSWGGLLSTADGPQTSQISENLVIGTSETNSVMTRYERAWQKLIRSEDFIGENDGLYKGDLIITRHPMGGYIKPAAPPANNAATANNNNNNNNAPAPAPTRNNNGNTATTATTNVSGSTQPIMKQTRAENDAAGKVKPPAHTFKPKPPVKKNALAPFQQDVIMPNGRYKVESAWIKDEEMHIAHHYRWICYQFEYFIRMRGPSSILKLPAGAAQCKVRFYPFRRMLFHKLEHELDTLVWDEMYREAQGFVDVNGEKTNKKKFKAKQRTTPDEEGEVPRLVQHQNMNVQVMVMAEEV